jgi:hypothetical protein
MRFPAHLFSVSTIRSEPYMAAMALVAVGMALGTWIVGPAVTHDVSAPPQATQDRLDFDAMVSRPDPPAYRTATPEFDMANAPNYTAAAKAKAQAEMGSSDADDDSLEAPVEPARRSSWRIYSRPDIHKVY